MRIVGLCAVHYPYPGGEGDSTPDIGMDPWLWTERDGVAG